MKLGPNQQFKGSFITIPPISYVLCGPNFNTEKSLEGAFSGHYETLRRVIDSFSCDKVAAEVNNATCLQQQQLGHQQTAGSGPPPSARVRARSWRHVSGVYNHNSAGTNHRPFLLTAE